MYSINKTARIAGFLYSIPIIPLSVLGVLYIPNNLIVPGNSTETVANISSHQFLFQLSILSALTIQVIHIFIVVLLYKILKPVDKSHATFMVIFILIGIPITMFNELNNFAALLLINKSITISGITIDQLNSLIYFFLELHKYGIYIATVFWGLWLFPMGYLVFKSKFLPKLIGILLLIGCFGYLIDVVIITLFPGTTFLVSNFTGWGELIFPFWLLIKGVNTTKWEKCYIVSKNT